MRGISVVNKGQNVGNSSVGEPQFYLPSSTSQTNSVYYKRHVSEHWKLLQQVTADAAEARPLIFMTILPFKEPSQGTSEFNSVAAQRYNQIEHDLAEIAATPLEEGGVEEGAVGTARALVKQLRRRELAPPEISWLGNEAIIMLWAIGSKRLALTITDGELAYTLRMAKQTVGRGSNIKPEDFDLLRIR